MKKPKTTISDETHALRKKAEWIAPSLLLANKIRFAVFNFATDGVSDADIASWLTKIIDEIENPKFKFVVTK